MATKPPTEPLFELVLSDIELENLGRFTAIWSQIDQMLFQAIAEGSRTRPEALSAIVEGTTSGQRLAILKRTIPLLPNKAKDKATDVCKTLGALLDKRNHIMHGVWSLFWNTDTDKLYPAASYEKQRGNPLYARQLEEICERTAKLSWKMADLLYTLNPMFPLPDGKPKRFIHTIGAPPNRPPPKWKPKPARRSSPASPEPDSAK